MSPRAEPPRGLLREILRDPERDHCPRARPVVSVHDDDDREYAATVRARALRTVPLRRRGRDHGTWAELRPDGLVPPLSGRKRRLVALRMRWHAARPIVLPGAVDPDASGARDCERLRGRLRTAGGLSTWLAERAADLAPDFRVGGRLEPVDPERDVETVNVTAAGADDLWLKVGRLSTWEGDRSLRLRVAFGREGDDDASADEARHELVRALAARALPCGALLAAESPAVAAAREIAERPLAPAQPILYWNAPDGGALFHHDAFPGPPEAQQAAVLYTQLAGATAWLGLAITDLAQRARELLALVAGGEMPWLADELGTRLDDARDAARDWSCLLAELVRPGCGALGPLVERPETTGFLADSGHAFVLGPGDAVVLPNFGLERTAMHSVFCASRDVATGLSVALRARP